MDYVKEGNVSFLVRGRGGALVYDTRMPVFLSGWEEGGGVLCNMLDSTC